MKSVIIAEKPSVAQSLAAATERMTGKADAERIAAVCAKEAVIKTVERKEKSEKPPALYGDVQQYQTLKRYADEKGYTTLHQMREHFVARP